MIKGQGKGGGIAKGVFMKERAGFSHIFLLLSNLSFCFFLSVEQSVIGLSDLVVGSARCRSSSSSNF